MLKVLGHQSRSPGRADSKQHKTEPSDLQSFILGETEGVETQVLWRSIDSVECTSNERCLENVPSKMLGMNIQSKMLRKCAHKDAWNGPPVMLACFKRCVLSSGFSFAGSEFSNKELSTSNRTFWVVRPLTAPSTPSSLSDKHFPTKNDPLFGRAAPGCYGPSPEMTLGELSQELRPLDQNFATKNHRLFGRAAPGCYGPTP